MKEDKSGFVYWLADQILSAMTSGKPVTFLSPSFNNFEMEVTMVFTSECCDEE